MPESRNKVDILVLCRFDTMGVQGQDFKAELLGPNPKPSKGLRKANLSPRTKALLEEVALSEQVPSCSRKAPF